MSKLLAADSIAGAIARAIEYNPDLPALVDGAHRIHMAGKAKKSECYLVAARIRAAESRDSACFGLLRAMTNSPVLWREPGRVLPPAALAIAGQP